MTTNEEMLRRKLEWVRRNILRVKDFAFYGDTYRDGVNNTVDYIVASITEGLDDRDEYERESS